MTNIEIARLFKAFCDERRIEIIKLLSSGEKCACKLQDGMNISQSTLSHHMKILCDAGIVIPRRDGKWTHYSLCKEGTNNVKEILNDLLKIENNKKDNNCF